MSGHRLLPPRAIVFDWHGTLVDTYGAMYRAIEAMLAQLDELGLTARLQPEARARTAQDQKLLRYLRIFRHLHPTILAERRISRTDIFDALFGADEGAKLVAHRAYNRAYAAQRVDVEPFGPGIPQALGYLRSRGLALAVVTNRSRRFFDDELQRLDGGRWVPLIDASVCGDEAARYKPAPDPLLAVAAALGLPADGQLWYVGDSATDIATARAAGLGAVFYNGASWDREGLAQLFPAGRSDPLWPDAIVADFDQLLDRVDELAGTPLRSPRPPRTGPPPRPAPAPAPDWHPALARLSPPRAILFDWHATLVDTLDAMYHAVDDMLRELRELGLLDQLVPSARCRSPEDARLVEYVRDNLCLHPRIKLDRKISRTDIFEVLFGDNEDAKQLAHAGFTHHYRRYFGSAQAFEPKIGAVLQGLHALGIRLGVITNRDREFFLHELATVDHGAWAPLFEVDVCGDDTRRRKPHPDQIHRALETLALPAGRDIWYVGDSTTDVIASRAAGITSVFFNGALWDQAWLERIFPGTPRYPDLPDVVVNDFSEFWALVLACRSRHRHD